MISFGNAASSHIGLRLYLKAFPVFNVLETCGVYLLTIDLGIVQCIKKLSSGFLNNTKFVGMDQITCKNCNKRQLNAG